MEKHRVGCSTAAKLDGHWINAGLCPAHWTFSVSGGLWISALASLGLDALPLHDDWMMCPWLNPFLVTAKLGNQQSWNINIHCIFQVFHSVVLSWLKPSACAESALLVGATAITWAPQCNEVSGFNWNRTTMKKSSAEVSRSCYIHQNT